MTVRVRVFEARLAEVTGEATRDLVQRCLDAGAASAKRLVPVDTGNLQGSIGVIEPVTEEDGGARGTYGTAVDYSLHVEFGTSKMAAQPYLRPSIDAVGVAAGGR